MWARNLLFVAVVVGWHLRPPREPLSARHGIAEGEVRPRPDDRRRVPVGRRRRWMSRSARSGRSAACRRPRGPTTWRSPAGCRSHSPAACRRSKRSASSKRNLPETRLDGWANHLLHDRRFADYFADRLARAYVGTEDGPLIAYRKRRFLAWLCDELLKNTSYAEIVRQMIAAQGLNTDKPAVNFIAATLRRRTRTRPTRRSWRSACRGRSSACASTVPSATTTSSNRRWKQTHFQALAAFFGQTRHVVTNVPDRGEGEYRFEDRVNGGTHAIAPAVPFLPELLPDRRHAARAARGVGDRPAERLLRPRHREPRLGDDVRPAAPAARSRRRRSTSRSRRRSTSSPPTSPPTATTCGGSSC